MSTRTLLLACLATALPLSLLPVKGMALDLGFQGRLSVQGTDNVEAVNSPDEENGVVGTGSIGIYGEQRSRIGRAAFSGELETRSQLDDDDSDFSTVSNFLGAAEIYLTPRSWRWYIGDILGAVRSDNGIQPINDIDIRRRNVFVTGPTFQTDLSTFSRMRARLLYVNQTEEDEELETLFNGSATWEREVVAGNIWGFNVNDIYTDNPEESSDLDFNRLGLSVFGTRKRGFLELYGELGATRYSTEEDSLTGLSGQLRATRTLGPSTSAYVALGTDLNDQTLSTFESLVDPIVGESDTGLEPESDGIFQENSVETGFAFQSRFTSIDLVLGGAQQDYRALGGDATLENAVDRQDKVKVYAAAALSRQISSRWRGELGVNVERQTYDNLDDETDSVLASARVVYRLSRSFELEASVVHDRANGNRTRFAGATETREDIDVTENRALLGLRWAPPSRASQDLTIELKSLLQ